MGSHQAGKKTIEPVQFRTAETWQDAVDLSRMARLIWYEHYTPIIGADQVDYMLGQFQSAVSIWKAFTDENTVYVQVFSGGAPAGYLACRPDPVLKKMFISKFYLLASFRGRGLARYMLGHVNRISAKQNLNLIWLTVNVNNHQSIQAYLKMGFVIKGKCLQEIGAGYVMDDYIMEKQMSK